MKLLQIKGARPRAILWAERIGIAGIAVEVLQSFLLFPRRSAKNGAPFEIAAGIITPFVLLVLLFLVSRRASRGARLILLLVGLAAVAAAAAGGVSAWWDDPPVLLGGVALALETAAIAFAFAPSARNWFDEAAKPAGEDREVALVVARAENKVIGKDGRLPWHLSEDLKHFKRVTMGTAMIMGRRTFEGLPGLLPGRRHIVVTRDPGWRADGAEAAHSAEEALALAGPGRVSVIGGAEIFQLFLPMADVVELTEVHADVDGDTKLDLDLEGWREMSRERHDDGPLPFSFVRLERRD